MIRRTSAIAAAGLFVLAIAGCATAAEPEGGSSPSAGAGGSAPAAKMLAETKPGLPSGDVTGVGTVLDTGDGVIFCLGPVAMSAPPVCDGPPIEGWSWDGVPDSTSLNGETWGRYALQGTWDGKTFTMTQPPLPGDQYQPPPAAEATPQQGSGMDEAELKQVMKSADTALDSNATTAYVKDGAVHLGVLWDDGSLQAAADSDFGAGTVVIESSLHPVG